MFSSLEYRDRTCHCNQSSLEVEMKAKTQRMVKLICEPRALSWIATHSKLFFKLWRVSETICYMGENTEERSEGSS